MFTTGKVSQFCVPYFMLEAVNEESFRYSDNMRHNLCSIMYYEVYL